MKLLLAFIFLILLSSSIFSQDLFFKTPDYEMIRSDIQDSTGRYFYPQLLKRYLSYDTTLTIDDYRHLYYGYIFQESYKPNWESPNDKKVADIWENTKWSQKDRDEIIVLSNQSLNYFPFDLRNINWLVGGYSLKGDYRKAKMESIRFAGLLKAIMSSGDGKKCETGIHLISVFHEKVIVAWEYSSYYVKSEEMKDDCHFLILSNSVKNCDLYFIIKGLNK